MSLFFLQLSIITFIVTHFWARRTRPEKNFSFGYIFCFKGTQKEFENKLNQWMTLHSNFTMVSKNDNEMVISLSPSLLTYGYFYHLHWTQKENSTEVVLCLQPKLVSMPSDCNAMKTQFAQSLELDNVG